MKHYILILAVICQLFIDACQQSATPQTIPDFTIVLPDSTQVFHSKDIPFGKTIVLIQFDPACRDCQEEIEYILANMQKFENINFYMVTRHSYAELMVFYNHLRLDTCRNLKIGIDTEAVIPKEFNIRSTPLTLVFDREKTLRAVFQGQPKAEEFFNIIKNKIKI